MVGAAFALFFIAGGFFRSMPSTAPSLAHRCRSGAVHHISFGHSSVEPGARHNPLSVSRIIARRIDWEPGRGLHQGQRT